MFVCHGGLFKDDGVTLKDIENTNRFMEIPDSGIMCDLLWADPAKTPGRSPSKRGISVGFGPDVTKKFCELNNLDMVVRSHEMKDEGYEEDHDGKCVTIFSAPNYCDQMNNKGAYIIFEAEDMKPKYIKFPNVEHPKIPPMAYANKFLNGVY